MIWRPPREVLNRLILLGALVLAAAAIFASWRSTGANQAVSATLFLFGLALLAQRVRDAPSRPANAIDAAVLALCASLLNNAIWAWSGELGGLHRSLSALTAPWTNMLGLSAIVLMVRRHRGQKTAAVANYLLLTVIGATLLFLAISAGAQTLVFSSMRTSPGSFLIVVPALGLWGALLGRLAYMDISLGDRSRRGIARMHGDLYVHAATWTYLAVATLAELTQRWDLARASNVIDTMLIAAAVGHDHLFPAGRSQPSRSDRRMAVVLPVGILGTNLLIRLLDGGFDSGAVAAFAAMGLAAAVLAAALVVLMPRLPTDASSIDLIDSGGVDLDLNALELLYQPIMSIGDRSIAGAEALLRVRSPLSADQSPEPLLASLNGSPRMSELNHWIFTTAFTAGSEIVDHVTGQNAFISINLSPSQLDDPALLEQIDRALAATNGIASNFLFEITEHSLLSDIAGSGDRLRALRERGFRIALDDFGSGFANLSTIADFELDQVKIDQSLIWAATEPRGERLLTSTVDMLSSFGLEVIVEGVETPHHVTIVERVRPQLAQGFGLHRPMRAQVLIGHLQNAKMGHEATFSY